MENHVRNSETYTIQRSRSNRHLWKIAPNQYFIFLYQEDLHFYTCSFQFSKVPHYCVRTMQIHDWFAKAASGRRGWMIAEKCQHNIGFRFDGKQMHKSNYKSDKAFYQACLSPSLFFSLSLSQWNGFETPCTMSARRFPPSDQQRSWLNWARIFKNLQRLNCPFMMFGVVAKTILWSLAQVWLAAKIFSLTFSIEVHCNPVHLCSILYSSH